MVPYILLCGIELTSRLQFFSIFIAWFNLYTHLSKQLFLTQLCIFPLSSPPPSPSGLQREPEPHPRDLRRHLLLPRHPDRGAEVRLGAAGVEQRAAGIETQFPQLKTMLKIRI